MNTKNFFLFLFPVVALVFIFANQTGLLMLSYISKPLMLSTLSVFFYLSIKEKINPFFVYVLLALLSSSIGDGLVALAQGDVLSSYFKWGLICFFITHIFYTIAFVVVRSKRGKGYLQEKPGLIIPFIIVLIAFISFLWPDIPGKLRIPITIYSLSMIFMVLTALNLKNQISKVAFSRLIFGTFLFIFSDIMIAVIRFKVDQFYVPQPRLIIILSYLAGHYLLMTGSLKLTNSN